jgi:hypothetical protein
LLEGEPKVVSDFKKTWNQDQTPEVLFKSQNHATLGFSMFFSNFFTKEQNFATKKIT